MPVRHIAPPVSIEIESGGARRASALASMGLTALSVPCVASALTPHNTVCRPTLMSTGMKSASRSAYRT